jgi:hypothetical protein
MYLMVDACTTQHTIITARLDNKGCNEDEEQEN